MWTHFLAVMYSGEFPCLANSCRHTWNISFHRSLCSGVDQEIELPHSPQAMAHWVVLSTHHVSLVRTWSVGTRDVWLLNGPSTEWYPKLSDVCLSEQTIFGCRHELLISFSLSVFTSSLEMKCCPQIGWICSSKFLSPLRIVCAQPNCLCPAWFPGHHLTFIACSTGQREALFWTASGRKLGWGLEMMLAMPAYSNALYWSYTCSSWPVLLSMNAGVCS